MRLRKCLVGIITGTLLASMLYTVQDVEAIDFSKNEEKYMQLCASDKLSNSNKSTCEDFNKYLKNKNKELASKLAKQKKEVSDTKATLESVQKELDEINNDISAKESEIKYVETVIENTQKEIDESNQQIKDRMYIMQSYLNDNSLIDYIFSADNFTDLFTRIEGYNDLTYNDKQLIEEMLANKKAIEIQKTALDNAKKVLEEQKSKQAVVQAQYSQLLEEQNKNVAATEVDATIAANRSSQMDAALSAFYENSKKDDVGHVSQLPTPPSNNSSSNTGNTGNNNSGSNTNTGNNNSNTNNNQSTAPSTPSQSSAEVGVKVANMALSKQGARYWWGAQGPTYFDCSGLVWWAHKQAGVAIGTRTTAAGYSAKGVAVSYNNLQPGDVITFSYGSGVAHIGIYIGNQQMVHASGQGSGTVGQYPDQCVKVTSIAPGSYFYRYIYNCRRLY